MDNNKTNVGTSNLGELLEPSFFLQDKIGTSAIKLITPEQIKLAEKCMQALKPTLLHAIWVMLHDIMTLARVRPRGVAPQIWRKAHEIRGISGSAGRKLVGSFCNLICHYLDDTDDNFRPNAALLTDLSVAANNAMSENADNDAELLQLFEECRIAVHKQIAREGRADDENY